MLGVGVEAGVGLFYNSQSGRLSAYGTLGWGHGVGFDVGASLVGGWVDNADAFWGTSFEYGYNSPAGSIAFASSPDPHCRGTSSGGGGVYGESVSIGPSLGPGDVHLFETYTSELFGSILPTFV